jgi:hypothetical protein
MAETDIECAGSFLKIGGKEGIDDPAVFRVNAIPEMNLRSEKLHSAKTEQGLNTPTD